MIKFSAITPFRLVRSLGVAGARNPAIYLLICDKADSKAVESDLSAEAAVQLGAAIHIDTVTELLLGKLPLWKDGSTRLVYFDEWLPELVHALDRHSALPVRDGGQLLLLADEHSAELLLTGAPNLRSRLTDVFEIAPDDLSGGSPD
jgi:hypothetical protein